MMKKIFACFIILFLIFGCASVKKVAVTQQRNDIRITSDKNGSLLINLQTPTFQWSKKGTIISRKSYAIDSEGNKYNLTCEPFQYANDYPKPTVFTSDFVWLIAPSNKVRMKWYNSVWSIHIVLKSERGFEVFETTFELNDA